LNEGHVRSLVSLLNEYDVKFHVCLTDMSYTSNDFMLKRKMIQADKLFEHITDNHHPDLVSELKVIADQIRLMPDQLFAQMFVMIELINVVLRDSLLYYPFSDPSALSDFRWIVDHKNDKETNYEYVWKTMLPAFIQSRQFRNSLEEKIFCIKEGNYDFCERFVERISEWPSHLPKTSEKESNDDKIEVFKLHEILKESFTLADSEKNLGLQIADIVTNAFRRAITGNLQKSGWDLIGNLMFKWGEAPFKFFHFGEPVPVHQKVQDERFIKVYHVLSSSAKSII